MDIGNALRPRTSLDTRRTALRVAGSGAALSLILFLAGAAHARDQYVPESGTAAYAADIEELNPKLTEAQVSGRGTFIMGDGQLSITLAAAGLAPSIMHLQHFHGFTSGGGEASCPPPEADTNGDGIIDLIETHPYTGKTLIPLNGAPAELEIKSKSYPVANADGLLTYEMTVPLDGLEGAIGEKYDIEQLSLADRVVYIHGVPEGASLPGSVQSLPGVPAHVTVPIACGVIESVG